MVQKLVTTRYPVDLRDEIRRRAAEVNMSQVAFLRYLLLITKDTQNEKK